MIRDAEPRDVAAITAVYADAVTNGTGTWETAPPDAPEMGRRLGQITGAGYPWLVAEGEGGVLGYGYAGPFRGRAAYDWSVEDTVYVAADARGRGVGLALLEALIARCEARGYRQMVAVLGDADGPSRGLHERAGFEARGRLPGFGYKHGRWLDLLLMQRALGAGAGTPPGQIGRGEAG